MRIHGKRRAEGLSVYQHDGAAAFRFVVVGSLEGAGVRELDQAWATADSVIQGKQLVFDLSALSGADSAGVALLRRMRESGARIVAPASGALREILGLPAMADESGIRTTCRGFGRRLLRMVSGRSAEKYTEIHDTFRPGLQAGDPQ
jgi:ABC-type transporter Mla MlaB component